MEKMTETHLSTRDLIRMSVPKLLMLVALLLVLFFLPAGTWDYWQAWVYMLVLLLPMSLVIPYLIKHNPELIRRCHSPRCCIGPIQRMFC